MKKNVLGMKETLNEQQRNQDSDSHTESPIVFKGAADHEKKPQPLVFFHEEDLEQSPYLQIPSQLQQLVPGTLNQQSTKLFLCQTNFTHSPTMAGRLFNKTVYKDYKINLRSNRLMTSFCFPTNFSLSHREGLCFQPGASSELSQRRAECSNLRLSSMHINFNELPFTNDLTLKDI